MFSQRVPLPELLQKKLIFVMGKGGVGKTTLSQRFAQEHSETGKRTLWIGFQDPLKPLGELQKLSPTLTHLNCEPNQVFEEYVTLKLHVPTLARLFLRNSVMQYLSKAAPGVHDLVLIGKVWFETRNYDQVIVDMPSTGYGLAMFNSVKNYARLLRGPVQKDAEKMLVTFNDPAQCGTLIVTLPEEMPIAESLELEEKMRGFFPEHPVAYAVNKRFPKVASTLDADPDRWQSPVPTSATDYVQRRALVEADNLKMLTDAGVSFTEFEWDPAEMGPT